MNQYVSSLLMHFPLHEFKPSASLHEKQGRLFSSRTRAAGRVTAAGTPPLTAPASSRGGTDQHSVTSIIQAAFCQLQASVKQSARSRSLAAAGGSRLSHRTAASCLRSSFKPAKPDAARGS